MVPCMEYSIPLESMRTFPDAIAFSKFEKCSTVFLKQVQGRPELK